MLNKGIYEPKCRKVPGRGKAIRGGGKGYLLSAGGPGMSYRKDGLSHSACRLRRLPLLQLLQNLRPELRDAACAQGENHVAVLRHGSDCINGFGGRAYVPAILPGFLPNALRQNLAG